MRVLLTAALFLLAACGQTSTQTGQDPSAGEGKDEAAQPTVQQGQPENLMDDGNNQAVPLDPPPPDPNAAPKAAASPAALQAFPASFQGRWGLVAADCEPGRADAKGLMEVGPKSLRFYESRGIPTRLAQAAPGRIEATLAMTGEGQEWTAAQALTLQADGKVLVREERDPPAALRYAKCPAR
jgi:hypothetical protein